jgi:hypothetical protein
MELNEIKTLLEKYYDGLTSSEEDQALRNIFCRQRVPDELAADREFFLYLDSQKKIVPMNRGLQKKLASQIDSWNKKERRVRYIHLGYKFASIAAVIAILIVSYLIIKPPENKHVITVYEKDTYADPKLAYAEVKRTLLYISEKLNKGTKPLSHVSRLNEAMEEFSSFSSFGSGLKQLELISKYYDQTDNRKQ